MKRTSIATATVTALLLAITGCGAPEPTPTVTVTVTASPEPAPTVTVTATPLPAAPPATDGAIDLTTDAGLCAADAEMTNLELNDALAPILGYPADRDTRTYEQDEAIRAYKNAAFERACPARAG